MTTKSKLKLTGRFKQNVKTCRKRGLPMDELWTVIGKLLNGEPLEEKYHAHVLHGDRQGQWECHIQPDWLLIWERLWVGELARECSTTRNSCSSCSTLGRTLICSARSIRNSIKYNRQ